MLFNAKSVNVCHTRRSGVTRLGGIVALTAACSAPLDTEPDGPPDFSSTVPGATPAAAGATPAPAVNNSPAAPAVPTNPVPGSSEQNPANSAPIAAGSNGVGGSAGMQTGAGNGAAGDGAGGTSMAGVAGSTSLPPTEAVPTEPLPTEPGVPAAPVTPAPNDPSPTELTAFFDQFPCGTKYSALGDGGWQFCLRLADGGAACARGSAAFTRVTFASGMPVTDVAQVSGQRDSGVAVVTTAGALHVGGVTSISSTPQIASGVINYSGGFHASVALVEQGAGFGILSWTDNGTPAPVTLPGGAQPVQVSANYGLACALSNAGDAYCWNAGGNHSLQLADTPTRMPLVRPLQMLSVGQNSVCGVSFDATLECQAAWYDSPFLPTEGAAPNFQVRQSSFPSVREVHAGFGQGIIVRTDGTAVFLPGGIVPPSDNPGQPFTGVSNIVAAGGDRGSACVQTQEGAVFCRSGAGVAQATLNGAPLTARAATCPL